MNLKNLYKSTTYPFNFFVFTASKQTPHFTTYCLSNCAKILALGLLLVSSLLGFTPAQGQSITGLTFFDGNNNGAQDSLELGFPNVVVNAYSGGLLVTSATSGSTGNYTLSTGIVTGTSYRIEFVVPSGYNDGAAGTSSKSSVQFAIGGSSHVDLGVYVPNQCGTAGTVTPKILVGCIPFVGDITLASNPYANHSVGRQECDLTPHQDDLTKNDIGVPYGLTIQKRQKLAILTTLSSPNTKDFPVSPDGTTAIYAVDYSGPDFTYKSFKLLARLSNLGIDVSNQFPISAGVDNIGEYGLGGITISEDEHYLYIINMGKGNIIRIDISALNYQTIPAGGFTSLSQLPLTEIEIPAAIVNCTNGRFRPSAIRMYAGKLYIGGICDASTSTDNSGLYAKIIEMNLDNGSSRVVFSHDLTTFTTGDLVATGLPQARWKYPFSPPVSDGNPGEKQPLFNDFGFDDTGSIIFTIVDRRVFTTDTNREPGYLVRTWKQPDGTFQLESDRQSGPYTSQALISHNNSRQGSNLSVTVDGPGSLPGPKWFFEQGIDLYDATPGQERSNLEHVNLANGGIYILPGTQEVVVGFTDPTCPGSAGMRYFDWTTGATKYGMNLTNLKYFSITGMSAVCEPAPIEIGNYVWKDNNRDGIQDANEPPLAGVTVGLFENCTGNPIATAITDANGNYYFSSATGTSTSSRSYSLALHSDSTYCLKLITLGTDPSVTGLQLTDISPAPGETAGALNTGNTLSNNDAFVISGLPTIQFSMNSAGQNTHTYDFGLIDQPCSLTTTVTASACDAATNTYSATVVATILNSKAADTISISSGGITQTFATTVGSSASFTTVFTGIVSDGVSHTVTASLPSCGTALAIYSAPAACKSILTINKLVDQSKANVGDLLTYTLVLTNAGPASATNVVVRDSMGLGLRFKSGSATAPAGTTFIEGSPVSTWTVGSLTPGQTLSLVFQAIADSAGILHNRATIPGDTASVCTTIPYKFCAGSIYSFQLTVPTGYPSYQWYRNGQLITGQSTNVLTVSTPGSYSLSVNNTTGQCADFSCCPFIIEEDAVPTGFQAQAIPVTCTGNIAQANGQLVLTGFNSAYTYQYSAGASFNSGASLSGLARVIPVNGVLVNTLTNPVTDTVYTIRVYNSAGCYSDVPIVLHPTVCACPPEVCLPLVVSQIRRGTHK